METFRNKGLNENLLKAIEEMGFTETTPIQEKIIPAILNSPNDLVGLAQTGTGKTAGFGLPILQQIKPSLKVVQSLILCPTRELCLQITGEMIKFAKNINNLSILAVYGGANIGMQIKDLKKGVQIVVGTPGRTLDLIKRNVLKVNNIEWLVLDEADEMLNMGFKEDLDAILDTTPKVKQTMLFSATMPDGVMHIAKNYMKNPKEISVGKKNMGAENVEHRYYIVKSADRYMALKRLVDIYPEIYSIVFCRTRQETKDVADKLIHDGYNADALHGDLSQAQRDQVMNRFRSRRLQLLIATDVAARGIDVNDLTHIINYNLPDESDAYIHRSGRTGRAGKKGISIAITNSRDGRKLKDIEKIAGIKFQLCKIPGGREICEKHLYNLIDKVENVNVDQAQIESFLPAILKKLEWLDREELIKRFVSIEFKRFLEYYKKAEDINVAMEEKQTGKKHRERNLSRFYINIGSKQNLKVPNLIGLINEKTSTRSIEIGKVEILKNFSFFEAEKNYESIIIDCLNGKGYGSTRLKVELSGPKNTGKNEDKDFKKSKRQFAKSNHFIRGKKQASSR